MLTTVYTLLFYLAALVLVGGLAFKTAQFSRAPAPLKIPTTPAPTSSPGVALRLAREVVLFDSLFRSNKWTWLFGWIFHAALLMVLVRHLRYSSMLSPSLLSMLAGLWVRRVGVERIRYITGPSDHLMLFLLVAIVLSGLGMQYVAPTDIVALKLFMLGLVYFDWQPLPADPLLLAHLFLVAVLMIIFPFSKLLHAPGVFFSPSRNQADNPRERRHITGGTFSAGAGGE